MTGESTPKGSARNWVFTAYAPEGVVWPTEGEEDPAKFFIEAKMKYIEYQLERAPSTGRLHMQGFMQLKAKVRYTRAKELIPNNPHVEIMRAGTKENTIYCRKEYTKVRGPWKYGIMVECKGFRSDLAEAAAEIKKGTSKREMAEKYPTTVIKYARGLQDFRHTIDACPKWRQMEVEYVWGETGTGKSRYAWDSVAEVTDLYKVENDGQWWDGYDGQKAILFDDFNSQVPIYKFLTWLDGHPLQVPVKGAFVYAKWTRVIITSNIDPEKLYMKKHVSPPGAATQDWWEDTLEEAHRRALRRRITKVIHMQRDDDDTEPDEALIAMGNT